jgi:hypothetical protein
MRERWSIRRSRLGGSARVEAVALAAVAMLPLVPYFVHLTCHGIERFVLDGDYAALELSTRFVATGRTLVGPYSRFHFNHPGPLWFFLVAPSYALFGGQSTGLLWGACAINAFSAAAIVGTMRLLASRAHALSTLLVVLVWLTAFGNTCVLPWNPLTVGLPLFAYLVFAAFFARGVATCACGMSFFGCLAAQTHLATLPTVVGTGLVSAAAFAIVARRRGGLTGRDRRRLGWAAALATVAFVPPVLEQVTAPVGNLTKLARFFLERRGPLGSWRPALSRWAQATTWLPNRALSQAIAYEGIEPRPMASVSMPFSCSSSAVWETLILFAVVLGAMVVAWRRSDRTSRMLLVIGCVASAIGTVTLRAVVGPKFYYLVFWTTAATAVLWLGVASTAAGWLSRWKHPARLWAAALAVVVLVANAAVLQEKWISNSGIVRAPDEAVRDVYRELRTLLAQGETTPVVHAEGAWAVSLALLLELVRDGVDVRVVPRDRWVLGRQLPPAYGQRRWLHVWASSDREPLEVRSCRARILASSNVALWGAPADCW